MRKITDFINITATVLLGLFFVLMPFISEKRLDNLLQWFISPLIIICAFIMGAAVVVLNIWILTEEWKAGGLRRNLRVTTDGGPSDLSIVALENLLLRELKAQGDVLEPEVTLEARREGYPMLCILEYKIKRQDDVITRSDEIKKLVRDVFQKLIPSGITIEIQSEIRDFVEPEAIEKQKAKSDFQGPVYDYSNTDEQEDHV